MKGQLGVLSVAALMFFSSITSIGPLRGYQKTDVESVGDLHQYLGLKNASRIVDLFNRLIERLSRMPVIGRFFGSGAQKASPGSRLFLKEGWEIRSSTQVKESGEIISTSGFKPEGWYPTSVPSTVLTALVKNGVYPDPYTGMNNMFIPDASDEYNERYNLAKYSYLPGDRNPWKDPYWFRTEFSLPRVEEHGYISLNFEGINYRADVWLNGHKVADSGSTVGMFRRFVFDVTDYANPGGNNCLAVEIYPLDHPRYPDDPTTISWPWTYHMNIWDEAQKENLDLVNNCLFGWDWAPPVRDRNMGIWQDVYVSITGPVAIRDPHVITDLPLPDTGHANVTVSAELVNTAGSVQKGVLRGMIGDIMFEKDVELGPGRTTEAIFSPEEYPQLIIDEPLLWWPNTYGEQNLYNLSLTFEIDGKISDESLTTFGIREITTEIPDGKSYRLFRVNGERVFCKGGNWVPDMALNTDRKKYYDEVHLAANANLNMIRVWGGGIVLPDDFYDACDRYGILVWQDFQGGNSMWPSDHDLWLKAASDTIKRLRNHPSLALWCGGNEGFMPEDLYYGLREILSELDTTRLYLPSSTDPGAGGLSSVPLYAREEGIMPMGVSSSRIGYMWREPEECFGQVQEIFMNEGPAPMLSSINSLRKFLPELEGEPYPQRVVDDRFGSAFKFDGWEDYVEVPSSPSLTLSGSFTISLWIKPEFLWRNQTALQKGDSYGLFEVRGDGCPYNVIYDPEGNQHRFDYAENRSWFENEWHHIAMVYTGDQVLNYVDGEISASHPYTAGLNASDDPLRLGTNLPYSFFRGMADEVRIYNDALSPGEVRELHDAPTKEIRPGNMVLRFDCEGDGLTAEDLSGYHNDGELKSTGAIPLPLTEDWGYHDFCDGNSKAISVFMKEARERFGDFTTVVDFVSRAQLMDADYRSVFEAWNSGMWDKTSGLLLWMLNPSWPSVTWQFYDWYLRPNAGYYYIKRACEPLHIQLNPGNLSVCVINTGREPREGLTATAEVYDLGMNLMSRNAMKVDVGADCYENIFRIKEPSNVPLYFVRLRLEDGNRAVSDNFYWLSPASDFTGLNVLQPVDLNVSAELEDKNGEFTVHVTIDNPTDSLAFFVNPSIIKGLHGEEVLPTYWSDNYFSILPGENESVTATFLAEDLDGNDIHLMIEGWNVEPREIALKHPAEPVTPKFEYGDFRAPADVDANEPFEVSVTITNTDTSGERITTAPLYLYVDDEPLSSARVGLAPGESREISFTTRLRGTGPHKVAVGDLLPRVVTVAPQRPET